MKLDAPVKPAYANFPTFSKTDGAEVADLAEMAGLTPDPEQRMALDVMFALRPNFKVAAFEFALICARQNGKSGLFKMAALGWLFVTDQRLIVWSAHEMSTTKEAFRDLAELIENCAPLRKRLAPGPSNGIYRGNGDEAIELASGARIKFKARTQGGGRGLTGDKVVLDEAMFLQPHHMGALLPTLSAVKDPQVVYGASAGLAASDVLRGIRDRGRAGGSKSLAYIEFCSLPEENACADEVCSHALGVPGCALDDVEYLRQANPALGRRITVDYLLAERQALPPEEFGRERAGWWDKPDAGGEALITAEVWGKLVDPVSEPVDPVSFGVYVSSDRTSAAIGVAGYRADGKIHVGVVPAVRGKPIDALPGTRWIPERVQELWEAWRPSAVVIDGHSAAASLITGIEALNVDVTNVNGTDVAKACGYFYDAVTENNLRHRGARPLARAVAAGTRRDLSDQWTWDRKDKSSDIAQLMAVTLAVQGLMAPAAPIPAIY